MLVYCAVTGEFNRRLNFIKQYNLPKFNLLLSFHYFKDLTPYFELTNNILIDSGAFTYQRTGLKNLKEYLKSYTDFIKKYEGNPKLKGFIEVDIDNKIGYDNVLSIRQELEEHSDKILPVWHKSLGVREFKKMCNDYPYVCISGFANEDIKENQLIHFVNTAHKYNAKIHGLGLARPKILKTVPFDSCDATSYLKVARFGRYKNRKLNSQYIRDNYEKIFLVELTDHIKFQQEYYKKYLHIHKDSM